MQIITDLICIGYSRQEAERMYKEYASKGNLAGLREFIQLKQKPETDPHETTALSY